MIRRLRTSSPAALLALFCATLLCAPLLTRAESPDNSVRVLADDEAYVRELLREEERSLVTLDIEPVDAEEPLPPIVGGELAAPAPNPYEATEPPVVRQNPNMHTYQAEDDPFSSQYRPRISDYLHHPPRQPQPQLQRESWLNRPHSFGVLFGGMFLDDPTSSLEGDAGVMYGLRFGWDFAPRWGIETRIGGAQPGLSNPNGLVNLEAANVFLWDASWLWYWTGDTRWQPYVSAGLGVFAADYGLPNSHDQYSTTFGLPFGVGLKYRHSTTFAMRIDLNDNVSFDSGLQDTMHNVSLTAGLEARFGGGYRRNYWPWNPGRDWR